MYFFYLSFNIVSYFHYQAIVAAHRLPVFIIEIDRGIKYITKGYFLSRIDHTVSAQFQLFQRHVYLHASLVRSIFRNERLLNLYIYIFRYGKLYPYTTIN